MQSNRAQSIRAALVVTFAVVLASGGCASVQQSFSKMPGMGERDTRPGLADVRVLGPKGQRCYDFCATSEASCKHICPHSTIGECRDDCVTDTKNCLEDCPELWRPPVAPQG